MEQIIYFVIGLVALSAVWILFPRNKSVSKNNFGETGPDKEIVIECETCGKWMDTIYITATGGIKVKRKIQPCPHCLMVQKDKGHMNGFRRCFKKGHGFIG